MPLTLREPRKFQFLSNQRTLSFTLPGTSTSPTTRPFSAACAPGASTVEVPTLLSSPTSRASSSPTAVRRTVEVVPMTTPVDGRRPG